MTDDFTPPPQPCPSCNGAGRCNGIAIPAFVAASDIKLGELVVILEGKVYRVDPAPDHYKTFPRTPALALAIAAVQAGWEDGGGKHE